MKNSSVKSIKYPSDSLIMTHLYWIFLVNNTHLGIPVDFFIGDCKKVLRLIVRIQILVEASK